MKKATKLMMMDHMGKQQSKDTSMYGEQYQNQRGYNRAYDYEPDYDDGYNTGYSRYGDYSRTAPSGYSRTYPQHQYRDAGRGRRDDGYGYDDYAGGARMVQAGGTFWMAPQQSSEKEVQPLTEATATEWTQKMRNADGSMGAHWRVEQTDQYRTSVCPNCSKWEFFAAMNMIYSDYCDVAKKLGVDRPEFYAHMAKAFLEDTDATDHKIEKYLCYIAK